MKKKTKIIITVVIILLLLIIALLIFLLCKNKNHTVSIKIDGADEVTEVVVKDGDILELPEEPKREGYVFGGWKDQNNKPVVSDIKIDKDTCLSATWFEEGKDVVSVRFNTGSEEDYSNLILEKGNVLVMPVAPFREGFIFVGWLNEDGNIITDNYVLNGDVKLTAKWISKDAKTMVINFNTDGGNNINNIIVENGKVISFPITPVKEGYVFNGWVTENGEEVNVDTIFTGAITLKATWKELYTCPSDCTVSSDGKTCSKTVTTNMVSTSGCPSGTKFIDGYCLETSTQYFPNWSSERGHYCNSSNEHIYKIIEGYGAEIWCAKKVNKVTSSGCPSGYSKNESICSKTVTVNCSINTAKEYKISD